jgi:hypothetical protein
MTRRPDLRIVFPERRRPDWRMIAAVVFVGLFAFVVPLGLSVWFRWSVYHGH